MKKMAVILAGAMLMMATGSALANSLNPNLARQVTINSAYQGENSLQTELDAIFGPGAVNAATDQLDVGMFQIAVTGSNVITPQLKFEWTSNAPAQTIGIFGWDSLSSSAITTQVFAGSQGPGAIALVQWLTPNSGTIYDGVSSTVPFSGIDRNFFGFYFSPNGGAQKYYTVDSLNGTGPARVLGYMPTLSGAAFSYEDGTDFDYQDAGFFVESINTVPEPGTIILLGAGLLGLGFYRRRRIQK